MSVPTVLHRFNFVLFFVASLVLTIVYGGLSCSPPPSDSPSDSPSSSSPHPTEEPRFAFDPPDLPIRPNLLRNPEFYDASIASLGDGFELAWLEYVPGMGTARGDRVWVGRRRDLAQGKWETREPLVNAPGRHARPTLSGSWLTCETQTDGLSPWTITSRRKEKSGEYGKPIVVSDESRAAIHHRSYPDSQGGLWIAWQEDFEGRFRIRMRHIDAELRLGPLLTPTLPSSGGSWHPSLVVLDRGQVWVAWDEFDGASFNVSCRTYSNGSWSPVYPVVGSPHFEGRVQLATDGESNVWIAWEEGAQGWGAPYRGNSSWDNIRDDYGPLHRTRRLRVGRIRSDGGIEELVDPLPMPSFESAKNRARKRPGADRLGVFYERCVLRVDGKNRLWVAYRHFWARQAGLTDVPKHHVEQGWQVYARALTDRGWSALYGLGIPQRDANQRLAVAPMEDGIAAVFTTGRTDRRFKNAPPVRGLVLASLEAPPQSPGPAPTFRPLGTSTSPAPSERRNPPEEETVDGETYRLYFGDLHRHTDRSLCWPFFDGSADDAYRYAIEAAHLDFVAVTDHSRDLALGNVKSQVWWRTIKEVTRYRLAGAFYPFFAFERSNKEFTDHNVISLRDDILEYYTPPLQEYWERLDEDTFTIPHNPINSRVWEIHDEKKRPLLEIYQGCRDEASIALAHEGLSRGHRIGFIASSDHLSTSASYAGVWSPREGREAIFRSLQARRTFGATAEIRLSFRYGSRWMGEFVPHGTAPSSFLLDVRGTAPLASATVFLDGEAKLDLPVDPKARLRREFSLRDLLGKSETLERISDSGTNEDRGSPSENRVHSVYVTIVQGDGERAWSSPIWLGSAP